MAIASRFARQPKLVIERRTEGATTARGHAEASYVDDGTTPGLIQESTSAGGAGGRVVTSPDLDRPIVDASIFLPIGAAVTERDRLRNQVTGARYEFAGPIHDAGARGRHLQADGRRVKS